MVTMNDIVAFVEKAMEHNLNMYVSGSYIKIFGRDDKNLEIWCFSEDTNRSIIIEQAGLNSYAINNLSDLEYSTYEYLCARVKEYSRNKTLEYFNNFFKEEESKLKDINDLDDKED